jgi:beta-galactosidase/beta-glucuronidase
MLRNLLILSILSSYCLCAPTRAATVSLDGDWHFLADPSGALDLQKLSTAQYVRPTRVPSSWQSQFADLRDYAGVAWYWRDVNVPPLPTGQVALLRFGAVDYLADVYVNGQKVGTHQGGYTPFEFDITSLLRPGANQQRLRVPVAART